MMMMRLSPAHDGYRAMRLLALPVLAGFLAATGGCASAPDRHSPAQLSPLPLVTSIVNSATGSGTIRESSSDFKCPDNQFLIGRIHIGDENADTRYLCGLLVPAVSLAPLATIARQPESAGSSQSRTDFECPDGQVLVGRRHNGDENGQTYYTCGVVSIAGYRLKLGERIALGVKESLGAFACPPGTFMTGMQHRGDENEMTNYYCRVPSLSSILP